MNITEMNYVDEAEKVIKSLQTRNKKGDLVIFLTTSKIRNLLSMAADIYNVVLIQSQDKLDNETKARIDYLRVRFLYESGRDKDVKNFVEKAKIVENLKSFGGTKKEYILFYRYMEALVAYHKYLGGKD